MKDLHALPKVRDSWSYLYVEHCRIDQEDKAIAVHDARGKIPVPCASLTLLMLGPGTTITHAAVKTIADCGCSVLWTGENAVRFYAQGFGETRSAARLLHQARLCADPERRLEVVVRMYRMRFHEEIPDGLTLQQVRGMEGVRVRQAYAQASQVAGVPWTGRAYRRDQWASTDDVNRALSAANSCLYGVCHAAILSSGYSPALGFIHTGKMLSFVYDVADLYKTEMTIPVAFRAAAEKTGNIESRVRHLCRDSFREQRLLQRVVDDIDEALSFHSDDVEADQFSDDEARPGALWDPSEGQVAGGRNRSDECE